MSSLASGKEADRMGEVVVLSLAKSLSEDFSALARVFLDYQRSRGLSDRTIEYYRSKLRVFARYLEARGLALPAVTAEVVQAYIAECASRSRSLSEHAYKSLRPFFGYLIERGALSHNPFERLEKPRAPRPVVRPFPLEAIEAMLATCGRDWYGVRDRAIILLLFDCGLRATELCGLAPSDVDWAAGTLVVRQGKGGKPRVVPFGSAARAALAAYLARCPDSQRLFVGHYGEPLTRYGLRAMIVRRAALAGISGLRASPHTLRHTFAISYLRNGGDVFSLQKLLGHTTLEMSRRYAELADEDVLAKHRAASPADRLTPPRCGRRRLK